MPRPRFTLSLLLLLAAAHPAVGQTPLPSITARGTAVRYVITTTPLVNLRTGPSTHAMVVGRAQKGDIFEVIGETAEWYRILMFSGDPRYVTKSGLVAPLEESDLKEGHGMDLPTSTARCRSIFWDTEEGMDRAAREASEVIPVTLNRDRHTKLKRILEDRILLEMFHIHGVQPALYGELVREARRERWG